MLLLLLLLEPPPLNSKAFDDVVEVLVALLLELVRLPLLLLLPPPLINDLVLWLKGEATPFLCTAFVVTVAATAAPTPALDEGCLHPLFAVIVVMPAAFVIALQDLQ